MTESTPSPNGFHNLFAWVTFLSILTLALLLNVEVAAKVLRLLTNRTFLLDFGSLLVITGVVSVIAGGAGVLFGKLVQYNEWLANSLQRLLRLGMWLPFFLLWGLPIWRSGKQNYWEFDVWLEAIILGVAAAGPTVFLGACYYHLESRNAASLDNGHDRFKLLRPIFLLALLVSILWQLYLVTAWPWKWATTEFYSVAAWAAVVIVAVLELLMNLLAGWRLGRDIEPPPVEFPRDSRFGNARSLMGAAGVTVVGLIVWQLGSDFFKGIVTPTETGRAAYALLVTGTAKVLLGKNTIWNDMQLSFLEIVAGFVVAVPVAALVSEVFVRTESLKPVLGLLSLTRVAPTAVAYLVVSWVGIGFWHKAVTIVCFVFFPLLQASWRHRTTRLLPRLLMAVDATLPYAFLGMVFAEAYAAVAGLGFLILGAGAQLFAAEQIATSLITFALLAVASIVLRSLVKRLIPVGQETVLSVANN